MGPAALILLLFVSLSSLAPIASAAPMFQGLGSLPGDTTSLAYAVSADGSTVTGRSADPSGGSPDAFRWTAATGMTSLGVGEPGSLGNDVSADGSVIVGESNHAFRWSATDGVASLGINTTHAQGVSADGAIVVGTLDLGFTAREAFRWTQETGLVGLGGQNTAATDVSMDGSVIVGFHDPPPWDTSGHGFLWTQDAGLTVLDFSSAPEGVSSDGLVVVGKTLSPSIQAFRWTAADGVTLLGALGEDSTVEAYETNFDGSVVVGVSGTGSNSKAFIWDQTNGMRDLKVVLQGLGVDVSGWRLFQAFDVSDDGMTIVGLGQNPLGKQEGWIAVIPEPSTALLLGLGVVVLAMRRRR